MFNWLRRKDEPPLLFADNESAFAHACGLKYRLLINAVIPGLVSAVGRRGSEGERFFQLRLAGPNGEFHIWGCTMADAPGYPGLGDLVAFRIIRIATELPEDAQLIGYISSKLEPVLDRRKGWRVATSYTPVNLKPELHM
ncbi:MAG TPA: hypothetical protein VGL27_02930 [Negativicutes bacterium]|jgi:hypothetical protein